MRAAAASRFRLRSKGNRRGGQFAIDPSVIRVQYFLSLRTCGQRVTAARIERDLERLAAMDSSHS